MSRTIKRENRTKSSFFEKNRAKRGKITDFVMPEKILSLFGEGNAPYNDIMTRAKQNNRSRLETSEAVVSLKNYKRFRMENIL